MSRMYLTPSKGLWKAGLLPVTSSPLDETVQEHFYQTVDKFAYTVHRFFEATNDSTPYSFHLLSTEKSVLRYRGASSGVFSGMLKIQIDFQISPCEEDFIHSSEETLHENMSEEVQALISEFQRTTNNLLELGIKPYSYIISNLLYVDHKRDFMMGKFICHAPKDLARDYLYNQIYNLPCLFASNNKHS